VATSVSPTQPRALSPARRMVLVGGGLLVFASLAYGVFWVVALLTRTSYERTDSFDPVGRRVTVSSDSGRVELRPSRDGRVHVETQVRYGLRAPEVVTESGPDGVRLQGTCGPWTLLCSVNLVVDVPPGLEVVAHSSAGSVRSEGLSGSQSLTSSAGTVVVEGASGPLHLRSSAGGVRADGLRAEVVDAQSSAGRVVLSFLAGPRDVRARSSAGGVAIALPTGDGPYAVEASTSAGTARVDVATAPTSARRVSATSSAGDVEVTPSR